MKYLVSILALALFLPFYAFATGPTFKNRVEKVYVANDTSPLTIIVPTSTVNGDFLLLSVWFENEDATRTVTFPPGFTQILSQWNDSTAGQRDQLTVAYKFANNEPNGYTVSFNGGNTGNKAVIANYQGVDVGSPINASSIFKMTGTGTNVTIPSVLTTATDTLGVITPFQWQGGTWSTFTNWTSRITTGVLILGDKAYPTSTSNTGQFDLTISPTAAGGRDGVIMVLNPARPIITFVGPSYITDGNIATLSWNVTNASTTSIDNGIGSVSAAGSTTVVPTSQTNYILTATNPYGTVTSSVSIAVLTSSNIIKNVVTNNLILR